MRQQYTDLPSPLKDPPSTLIPVRALSCSFAAKLFSQPGPDQRASALICGDPLSFVRQQLPQHVLQNAAVLVVENFLRSIDAHQCTEFAHASISAGSLYLNLFSIGKLAGQQRRQSRDLIDLIAPQSKRFCIF